MRVLTLPAVLALFALVACGETPTTAETLPTVRVAPGACGRPGQPDCPLQAWMKGNATPALGARDFATLGRAFERMIALEPEGFAGWKTSAAAGAEAARNQDLEGCRAACKACHDGQRARYRAELRSQPLP